MELAGRRIHFIGAGGVGMSALARYAAERGAEVSACDRERTRFGEQLEARGIPFHIGHDSGHVAGADLVVATSAVAPDHPERRAAGERCMRRGTFLARCLESYRTVGIAGSHGKTSTTAIVAHLLIEAGLDPTVFLGGSVRRFGGNLRIGGGGLAVAELDESDGSFLEPACELAVITNIDSDHLAHYGTEEAVREAFATFAESVPAEGTLLGCVDDEGVRALLDRHRGPVFACGTGPAATLRAESVREEAEGMTFRLVRESDHLGEFMLPLPGRHNLRNALLAVGVASALGVDNNTIHAALATCPGVDGRLERVGTARDVAVYLDYAHHPTEIRAALSALRPRTAGRLLVAFQPHLYSRTRDYADSFGRALADADEALLVDVYPAREAPLPGVSSDLLVRSTRAAGGSATGPVRLGEMPAMLAARAGAGDTLVCMGAGDIGKAGDAVLEHLARGSA